MKKAIPGGEILKVDLKNLKFFKLFPAQPGLIL
jgi:hypothetical protein